MNRPRPQITSVRRPVARPPERRAGARAVAVRHIRRRPALIAILGLIVLLFLSGMATGFDLAVRLNYIFIILLVVSWLWARAGVIKLDATVRRPKGPFSVGDTISEEVIIHNRGRTPKAWVEVEDRTNLPGVSFRHVTGLGFMIPFSRLTTSVTLRQRGEYTLGPLVIRASDPFGIFPQEVELEGTERLLVYPRAAPIPDFAHPNINIVGDNSRRQRANVVSPDVSTVREYSAGDSVSRIHWLTTARIGRLMVKQFDQGTATHVWLLFDQSADSQAGEGEESTDEYGATVVASVVERYGSGSLPLGYAAHGSHSLTVMPDRSTAQRDSVMRHVASSLPTGRVSLLEMLTELEPEFSQSTSLVVVTAAGAGDWVAALAGLQRRGVKTSVVLMDRESFGGAPNSAALLRLIESGISTFSLGRGQSVSAALSSPVTSVDMAREGGPAPRVGDEAAVDEVRA